MAMTLTVQRQSTFRVLLWFAWVFFAWFILGNILWRVPWPLPHIIEVLSVLGGAGAGLGAVFAAASLAVAARS